MTEAKKPISDARAKSKMARASQFGLLLGVGLFIAFPLPKHGIASDIVGALGIAIIAAVLIHRYKIKRRALPNKPLSH